MKKTALTLMLIFALSLSVATGVQTAKSLPSEELFDVDLLYAYVEPEASNAVTVLNFTKNSNLTLPANSGITEVYTVQVFSDGNEVSTKGAIGCQVGKGIDMELLMDLAMGFGSFGAYANLGLESFEVSYSPLNPALNAPISLNLVRLGCITVEGNSTDVDFSSPETLKHLELTKYQDGFLYNTIFSEEELSQIDLLDPQLELPNTTSPSPEQTPTSSPYPEPAEQETMFGVAITIAVIGAGLGLLVYFIKRK